MFERFSSQARQVIVSAQEEARDLDHNYIGTEHVLLGLLADPHSVASTSLGALGYTHDSVRQAVETVVGRGRSSVRGHIPFTPRAKKVLELGLREALQLNHRYIGTEHILLGLLREREGRGAKILADRHPLDRIQNEVLTRVVSAPARPPDGAGRTPAARQVLALASELAGDSPLGSHHLLEAILQQPDSAAAKVLTGAGVDLQQLTVRLDEVRTEDTADDTPAEAAARQLELSITDEAVTIALRDPGSIALGRQIVQLNDGPPTARSRLALLDALWAAVDEWLATTAGATVPPPGEALGEAEQLVTRGIRSRLRRRRAV